MLYLGEFKPDTQFESLIKNEGLDGYIAKDDAEDNWFEIVILEPFRSVHCKERFNHVYKQVNEYPMFTDLKIIRNNTIQSILTNRFVIEIYPRVNGMNRTILALR